MKINENLFLLSVQKKINNKTGEMYLILTIADTEGNTFAVMTKQLKYEVLETFRPYHMELNLSNSKYGMRLQIENIEEQ